MLQVLSHRALQRVVASAGLYDPGFCMAVTKVGRNARRDA